MGYRGVVRIYFLVFDFLELRVYIVECNNIWRF